MWDGFLSSVAIALLTMLLILVPAFLLSDVCERTYVKL